jgi:hypothetical protein
VVQFLVLRRAQSWREVPKVRLGISTPIRCTLVYQGAPLMCQGASWNFKTRPSWQGGALAGRGGPASIKAHLETQGAPVWPRARCTWAGACTHEPAARGRAGVKCARAPGQDRPVRASGTAGKLRRPYLLRASPRKSFHEQSNWLCLLAVITATSSLFWICNAVIIALSHSLDMDCQCTRPGVNYFAAPAHSELSVSRD